MKTNFPVNYHAIILNELTLDYNYGLKIAKIKAKHRGIIEELSII